MAVTNVECGDFLEFQDTLKKMRQFDDKIIYMLNTTIPTESFKEQNNATSQCKDLFEQIQTGHAQRKAAINKCLVTVKQKVKNLKEQKDTQRDNPLLIKSLRKEQSILRLLEVELDVEEVVKKRTMKIYSERCRSYYKPLRTES